MTNSSQQPTADFVLKHRIVGAAFLLLFGALFLPWLLGPASEAVKAQSNQTNEIAATELTSEEVEDDLANSFQQQQFSSDEQVYVSKITPLDQLPNDAIEDETATPDNTPKQSTPTERVEQTTQAEISEPQSEETEVQEPPVMPAEAPNDVTKIEVGWVVQVGIYTNTNGVAKVLADLRAKGFSPSTSVVDTNRGRATGTRIWLGPYAQRVDAAKSKTRLTERTGEAGFIRAYP